jgi:N-methylhydantoinase B
VLLPVLEQLEEVASAMDATLRQGAASAAIGRHGGSAAGFYTGSGALLIGGRESHPLLAEGTAAALAVLVDRQIAAGLPFLRGDLYWTNDPRSGGAGLEDLILATPVVRNGRHLGFVALTATHSALGRATLASVESLRREGVVLPWTRVGHLAEVQPEILELVAANAESPSEFLEDLRVQIHSLLQGQRAVEELLNQHGAEILSLVWDALAAGSRRALATLLDRLKGQTAEGRVPPFVVRISEEDRQAVVRVESQDSGQTPPFTAALARAAVRAALREVLTAESSPTCLLGGWEDTVRIETPWDQRAAGVSTQALPMGPARFSGAQGLADAVLAAFAETLPHLVRAQDGGDLLVDLRGERADGSEYRMRLELGGGLGASVFGDGMSHATPPFHPQHLRPVEDVERAIPWRIVRFALRPDSAGPGQYRGGLGAVLELELLEGRATADVMLPGSATGLRGGMRGAGARLTLVTPEEGMREYSGPGRVTLALRAGHRLILESPGGGGWAIPFQRSIMRIEEDLTRALITPHQSKTRYGVVLRPGTLEKDDHLTYRVRHYLLSTLTADDIIAGEELLD